VEQPGFVTAVVSNVIVEVASERRVDVKLVVAGAQNLVLIAQPCRSKLQLPSFAADMTSSIDPLTGRGTGFLPITVTRDVGIGTPSWAAAARGIFS
jgi:hypothetical protein